MIWQYFNQLDKLEEGDFKEKYGDRIKEHVRILYQIKIEML